jgi:hydrogenase nickel incorporation protein HypB
MSVTFVCPAEFDTGESIDVMPCLSRRDDKPLKYPLMFSKVKALVINKIDVKPYFDFDSDAVRERVNKLNRIARFLRFPRRPAGCQSMDGLACPAGKRLDLLKQNE